MKKIYTAMAASALVLLPAAAAFADGGHGGTGAYGHSGYGWGAMGWGGMIFGPIFMIAIFAAVIALAVMLVRWITTSTTSDDERGAIDILEERFARGEIDAEEFEARRRTLDS